jgi:hypothetical protein
VKSFYRQALLDDDAAELAVNARRPARILAGRLVIWAFPCAPVRGPQWSHNLDYSGMKYQVIPAPTLKKFVSMPERLTPL